MPSVSKNLQNYRMTGEAIIALARLLDSKQQVQLQRLSPFVESGYDSFTTKFGTGYDVEALWAALVDGGAQVSVNVVDLVRDELRITHPDWDDEEKIGILDGQYDEVTYHLEAIAGGTSFISVRSTPYGLGSVEIYSKDLAEWGEKVSMDEVLAALEPFRMSPEETVQLAPRLPFRVFIGHGNDHDWRVLRDELRDKHGFEIEAFEGRPRIGQTIKDVLFDMGRYSTAGVVVLTRADRTETGEYRGRQNVVHELGLFQGLLGWEKVIIVMEEGVALPTNLDGTQQVRYPSGYIQTAVGETVAALNALKDAHEQEGHHP